MPKFELLTKYRDGNCTPEEKALVEDWYSSLHTKEQLSDSFIDERLVMLDASIHEQLFKKKAKIQPLWWKVAAAAVLVMGIGLTWLVNENNVQDIASLDVQAPVGMNSIITLENNKTLQLQDIHLGDTIYEKNYLITRLASGELKYLSLNEEALQITNTINTKPGDNTEVILADGTKVWINSNSTFTYPIAFNEKFREVLLDGEAYFEVTSAASLKNKELFYVKTRNHTIEVRGTQFNVNTYKGNYETTLLEGKIALQEVKAPLGEVPYMGQAILLNPGQQFKSVGKKKELITMQDPLSVLDWKNGYFDFTNLEFDAISEKLTNWYGLPFELENTISNQKFYGQISKEKSLAKVLNMLEQVSNLKFQIKSNRIVVSTEK